MNNNSLYEKDFYTWSLQQAQLLREQKYHAVDWEHVIEEVEDLGRSSQCPYSWQELIDDSFFPQ